jgi:transcriptional regulator with XRE-family HTH domain
VGGTELSNFGELLRRYGIVARLTHEELAERVGLHGRRLQALERGLRRSDHPATSRRLAADLGLGDTERAALFSAVDKICRACELRTGGTDVAESTRTALTNHSHVAADRDGKVPSAQDNPDRPNNLPSQLTSFIGREREPTIWN